MVNRNYKVGIFLIQKKQQGVVLVVSLVFLVALTAVAAALMQNTTTDMKMSGASEEKVVAVQEVVGAVDEYIFTQVTGGSGNNSFALPAAAFNDGAQNVLPNLTVSNKDGDIQAASLNLTNNRYGRKQPCPRFTKDKASEVGTVYCNMLTIQITRQYGRNSTSTVEANSGVAQQLIGN
jgi:Tfp pilus assembly protein PilX